MTDNFGRAAAKFGDVTYYIDGEVRTASAVTKLLQDLKKGDDDTSGVSDAGVLTGAYVDADRDASIGDRTGAVAHRCATGAKTVPAPSTDHGERMQSSSARSDEAAFFGRFTGIQTATLPMVGEKKYQKISVVFPLHLTSPCKRLSPGNRQRSQR